MANIVDPDQMMHYMASDQGLHCLQVPVCLSQYFGFNYGIGITLARPFQLVPTCFLLFFFFLRNGKKKNTFS